MAKPFLWIALDGIGSHRLNLVRELDAVEGDFGFKINLDYVLTDGIENAFRSLRARKRVFVDLKMWNGSRTMASVFRMCADVGVAAVNAYAFAGGGDSREAGYELKKAIDDFRSWRPVSPLQIYSVTILSHYGEQYALRMLGGSLEDWIADLTKESVNAGVDGVIMPGSFARDLAQYRVRKVLTGYRPDWFKDDRHSESFTSDDVKGLKNYEIVCGSPIMRNKDMNPVDALRRVLEELPDLG